MQLREFHPSSKRLTRSTLFLLAGVLPHILGYKRINSLNCFHPKSFSPRLSTARILVILFEFKQKALACIQARKTIAQILIDFESPSPYSFKL
jgi:hypothetical protein